MNFFHTSVTSRAVTLAVRTLKTGFVSEGRMVSKFERMLTARLDLINPVALNSGTSALHLALAILNIGPGDEVILPAQTFAATGLVILMQRAKPIFADIQYTTGNIDPNSIKRKITEKTKAIIPVHWGGYPCDMVEILALAKRYNLAVIEDAAHALGAIYKGKPIGALSRFTAFSFQAIKHLTTGDGGVLCCLNKNDYRAAKRRRWFGIDRTEQSSILGERTCDIFEIGYKYHMNDLAAAIGLGNLENFKKNLIRRQEIATRYCKELKRIPGLQLLEDAKDRINACWLFTVLVERRVRFIKQLREQSIPASVVHLRIDRNSVFGGLTPGLLNQNKFDEMQVSIPLHSGLTDNNVTRVIRAIKKGW